MTTTPDTPELLVEIAEIKAAIRAQVSGTPSRMVSQGDEISYRRMSVNDLERMLRKKQWEAYRAGLLPMPAGGGAIRIRPR